MNYTVQAALRDATWKARESTCAKIKRGVVIFSPAGMLVSAYNSPPEPFRCDESAACAAVCNKVAVHAEEAALLAVGRHAHGCDLMHVKVVNGAPVPSGPPSCWQCSRAIVAAGIAGVWLLHEEGLRRYEAGEFHRLTLAHHGITATVGRVGDV